MILRTVFRVNRALLLRNKTKDKDDVTQNNPTVGETSREERGHEGTCDHVEDVWGP